MEIVGRVDHTCERPLLLITPVPANKNASLSRLMRVPATHHVDANGRFAIHPVVNPLEKMIEPAKLECIQIQGSIFGELRVADVG